MLDDAITISFWVLAVALLLLERMPTLQRATAPVKCRWLTNAGLMLLGGLIASIAFPSSIMSVAHDMDGGLISSLRLPLWMEVLLVLLLLDCWRYWEHRAFHEIPLLWRLHVVHHSDTSLDVTTGERHHPFEKLATTVLALILVFALGFSAQALGIYLLLATLSALYTHANITLPDAIDRSLRRWLVTPAVHAIHHSSQQPETDSNFGSLLTVWDRLFGTYREPSRTPVPSVGLEQFRSPGDATLALVLLQPFSYRRAGSPPGHVEPERDETSPVTPLSDEWRQALRYGGIGLCLALLALWPTVRELLHVWSSADYQYAWLVVPMFIYVVGWHHRDGVLAMTPRPGHVGLPLILLAALLWLASSAVDINVGEQLAFVLALQGIALCSLGWHVYRRLLPAMLMLFLLVPSGDLLQPVLRGLTVKWIEWFAIIAGLPHSVEGYVIHVGTHRYVVIDACSGLAFVSLAGFLGYAFGLLLFRSLPKILLFAALGAVLGILTNAARVSLIVGLDWLRGSQMDLAAHANIQWLVLLVALAVLLMLASRLAHEDGSENAQAIIPEKPGHRVARYAPVLAGSLVLACVGSVQALAYRADNAAADHADSMQQLAKRIPGSRWLGGAYAAQSSLGIPLPDGVEGVVVLPVNGGIRLNESSLRPEDEETWRHADTAGYRECSPGDCLDFVHTTWRRKGASDYRHTFYIYYVGDMATDSALAYRLASGWNRLTGARVDAGLIGFKLDGAKPDALSLNDSFRELRSKLREARSGSSAPTMDL